MLRHAKAELKMLIRCFPNINTPSAPKIQARKHSRSSPSIKRKNCRISSREICKIR